MGETKVPPALPGEVWRGLDGDGDLLAVTESGDGHIAHIANESGEWGMSMGVAFREHVFHLWAMSERARADIVSAIERLVKERYDARSDLAAFRAVSRDRL